MPDADKNNEQYLVAYKDFDYPVGTEGGCSRQIWLKIEPCQRCEYHIEKIPWKEIMIEPFCDFDWFWWPGKDGIGGFGAPFRLPITTFVARHAVDQPFIFIR